MAEINIEYNALFTDFIKTKNTLSTFLNTHELNPSIPRNIIRQYQGNETIATRFTFWKLMLNLFPDSSGETETAANTIGGEEIGNAHRDITHYIPIKCLPPAVYEYWKQMKGVWFSIVPHLDINRKIDKYEYLIYDEKNETPVGEFNLDLFGNLTIVVNC